MFKKSFHIGLTIVAGMLLLAVMGMGSGTEAGSSSEVVTNSVIVHPGVSTSAVAYCPTGTFIGWWCRVVKRSNFIRQPPCLSGQCADRLVCGGKYRDNCFVESLGDLCNAIVKDNHHVPHDLANFSD